MKLLFVISYLMGVLFPAILCWGCSSDPNYGIYDNDTNYEDESIRVGIKALLEHQEELWMDMENGNSSNCPELYQRYSTNHTYCKKSTCDIITSGVTEEDKKFILEMHNSLRNKLALGNENRYRHLPAAANMMQMEWDDELARVAQAHANLCIYSHDNDGRKVENFEVGQNLLLYNTDSKIWQGADGWYKKEVCFYLPEYIHPFHYQKEYGHFTQVTWANTWKIGCGFTAYRNAYGDYGLYTCNYGPSGNWVGGTHYITGEPCSQCPKNTNCSKEYPGLCKSSTENGPQRAKLPSDDFLLICDFSEDDTEACNDVIVTGPRNFTTRHIYTGDYKTVVLEGGESITIDLGKTRNTGGFCPFVYIQYGPNKAKDAFGSKVKLDFTFDIIEFHRSNLNQYRFLSVGLRTNSELKVKFMLEVEEGAAPQYFDIQAWGVFKGNCKVSIYGDSVDSV